MVNVDTKRFTYLSLDEIKGLKGEELYFWLDEHSRRKEWRRRRNRKQDLKSSKKRRTKKRKKLIKGLKRAGYLFDERNRFIGHKNEFCDDCP